MLGFKLYMDKIMNFETLIKMRPSQKLYKNL